MLTRPLRIDCITVCVDFDDYLELTIEGYRATFDNVVVVTSAADQKTAALCAAKGVGCSTSERVQFRDHPFNLPALINDGYRAAMPSEWVCKIDPDVYLPQEARALLEACLDDPDDLWGTNRHFCKTRERFDEFVRTGDHGVLEPPYEMTADVLGFLQLFNVRSRYLSGRSLPYEEDRYEGPSRTNDRLFSSLWPVEHRRKLPFDVVHLGLDAIGTNWKGRQSPRFCR